MYVVMTRTLVVLFLLAQCAKSDTWKGLSGVDMDAVVDRIRTLHLLADHKELSSREVMQELQRKAIREKYLEGKPVSTIASSSLEPSLLSWNIPCETFFYSLGYGLQVGCTPSICSRFVVDNFIPPEDAAILLNITESAMQNLFHQNGATSLAPMSSTDRLGLKGALMIRLLILRVRLKIMADFGLDTLYESGALLSRIEGVARQDPWNIDPTHDHANVHVDKANIATYDYSAVLYLNEGGKDFIGGEFAFVDRDADRLIGSTLKVTIVI